MKTQFFKFIALIAMLFVSCHIIAKDATHFAKSPISIDNKGNRTVLVTDGENQVLNMRVLSERTLQLEVTKPVKGKVYNANSYEIPAYVNINGKVYTVVGIGDEAFAVKALHMNTSTWEIEFPSTLRYIGDKAFCRLNVLGSIDLPEGLISIGKEAFWQCGMCNTYFKTIYIPKSVERIGKNAFRTVSMNFSKTNGYTRACISGLPDFVNQSNCGQFGIDESAVRTYNYSQSAVSPNELEDFSEKEKANNKKKDVEALLGILSLTAGMASQVASGVAEQTQPKKEAMADEFYGLTMDEYLNPSKISKEKLDKLIDPRMAIAKQNAIEQSYYDEFRRHCKKPDGSDYSYMEYKYLLYLQEQESGGDSIFDRGVNEDDEEMEEQEDAEEQDEKSGTFYEEYHGTDISSQGYSSVSTTTKNKSKTEEAPKLKSKEQYKTGKVDDNDYKFQKKVQLFKRDGSKAKLFCNGELYKKGAHEYVKIGDTYFPRAYSNWGRFSNQIVYGGGGGLLYYN